MSSFFLEKWYMDAVDPQGRAFIGYHAAIRWKKLRVIYSGFIRHDAGTIAQRSSFRAPSELAHTPESISWKTAWARAQWTNTGAPLKSTLLDNEEGTVTWTCFFPGAAAIHQKKQQPLEGAGYAEQLILNIPPWKLPIKELRWGRFISSSHRLVWIEWRGPHPKCVVFHNGTQVSDAVIEDDLISLGNSRLTVTEKKELRSGCVISTVFSRFQWLKRFFPLPFLRTIETKWLSKGAFSHNNQPAENGWLIHEKVMWV